MPTNKTTITIELTHEQKKDFEWALRYLIAQGAKDEGRACQLMSAEIKSGAEMSYLRSQEDHKIHNF